MKMKMEISALMDGEIFEDEAEKLIDRIGRGSDEHKDWEVYHLIGDVLRQPDHIHCDLSANIRERLRDEPTVLAPRSNSFKRNVRNLTLSAAASLAAVGVVAWMSQQIGSETLPQMASQNNTLRPVSFQMQSRSNDYLMAHQEFSPSTDVNGGASYIRMVSYGSEGK